MISATLPSSRPGRWSGWPVEASVIWSLRWIVEFGGRTLTSRLNGPNAVLRSLQAMPVQQIVSPIDGSVYAERTTASRDELEHVLARAAGARDEWRSMALADRQAVCERMVANMEAAADDIAVELAHQMGRPVRYGGNEIRRGFQERARHMISIAADRLADIPVDGPEGFQKFIRRDPLGSVLVVAPWNYPYLCAVNSVVPALLAGNTVVLKHATQTLLCAERMSEAFAAAGAPDGVFQHVVATHDDVAAMIADPRIDFVVFTGSVEGGHVIQRRAGERFIGTGLELGGKDPSYVRPDCDLDFTIAENVDGSFFNSGQSCCAIERIYVHADVYDDVRGRLRRGDPRLRARQPAARGDDDRADGHAPAPPTRSAIRWPRRSPRARGRW